MYVFSLHRNFFVALITRIHAMNNAFPLLWLVLLVSGPSQRGPAGQRDPPTGRDPFLYSDWLCWCQVVVNEDLQGSVTHLQAEILPFTVIGCVGVRL